MNTKNIERQSKMDIKQKPYNLDFLTGIDTNLNQLNEFQKYLFRQIQHLQQSGISDQGNSFLQKEPQVKDSIINMYFQSRKDLKANLNAIWQQFIAVKRQYESFKIDMRYFLTKFNKETYGIMQNIIENTNKVCHERNQWKIKCEMIKAENQQLKKDLKEWEQAKMRRKNKVQTYKENPTVTNVENIKSKIILNEFYQSKYTPLKERNCETQHKGENNLKSNLIRFTPNHSNDNYSSIQSMTNIIGHFDKSLQLKEHLKQRRSSKQKIKLSLAQ